MNNVAGIDVSKGKSMVSVLRPFGEVVAKPFSIGHTGSELKELADYLKSLDGETRVVMEHTGRYYEPVARFLHEEGVFVSAVNPKLIKDYGNNTLRKVKTDKADDELPGNVIALVCVISPQRYEMFAPTERFFNILNPAPKYNWCNPPSP